MKLPTPPDPMFRTETSVPRYRVATISDIIAMPMVNSPPRPIPTISRLARSTS